MKLMLVRHGQTDWNLEQRFQGKSDIPLNEAGRKQAQALAKRLSALSFNAVYSSDLQRATETATIIYGSTFQKDTRLREINFGDWEGLTYDEIQKKYPDELTVWEKDIYKMAPPHGETLEELAIRVQSMLDELREKHDNHHILIISHGGVLQTLICLALKLPPTMYWQFHLSIASLSEIAFYPAGATLNLLNDTSHLERGLWDN